MLAHHLALSLILAQAGAAQPAGNLPGAESGEDAARTPTAGAADAGRAFKTGVADYEAAQARYEAALRDNARARNAASEAARTYDAARARYETDMADRREGKASPVPAGQGGAKTAAGMTAAPKGFRTKMVCRTFRQTGSLVQTYRTCKQERDWDREHDDLRTPRTTSGSCGGAVAC